MMVLVVVFALSLPVLAVWTFLPKPVAGKGFLLERVGRIGMAVVLGIGLSSFPTFAWLLIDGHLDFRYAITDATIFAAILFFQLFRWLRSGHDSTEELCVENNFAIPVIALSVAMFVAVGYIAAKTITNPNGEYDAWIIWNMKARFFFRAGDVWKNAFAPELAWTSTEYPLLLPLAIARVWSYSGETIMGPASIATVITLATPLILAGSVAAIAGTLRGAIAGLILFGTPGFVSLGASQYADIPVAAFLLTAVTFLFTPQRSHDPLGRYSLVFAGFALGLAAWTKNEGLAGTFVVVAVSIVFWGRYGYRQTARSIASLTAGIALPGAAWLTFHSALMPRLTGALFLSRGTASLADRLLNVERWIAVGWDLTIHLPGLRFGFPAFALGIALLVGLDPLRLLRSEATWVVVGLYLTYFGVFVATGWELEGQLTFAADRILLQLWPLILFALFRAVPDESDKTPATTQNLP